MSNEQKELFDAWLSLRTYAREAITAYSSDKERIEKETEAFSKKWDSIKDEEKGWNTLLAVAEQKRTNLFASETGSDSPFPEMGLTTEEIIKAIESFISGVRPVVLGPQPEASVEEGSDKEESSE